MFNQKRKYTVEQYLQMELKASYKSEYYDGEIFPIGEGEGYIPDAIASVLPPHNQILSNIIFEFQSRLKGKDCRTLGSDQ